MHHPMTPIEVITASIALIATGALLWWGLSSLMSIAGELYERCRPMREESREDE